MIRRPIDFRALARRVALLEVKRPVDLSFHIIYAGSKEDAQEQIRQAKAQGKETFITVIRPNRGLTKLNSLGGANG